MSSVFAITSTVKPRFLFNEVSLITYLGKNDYIVKVCTCSPVSHCNN